MFDVHVHGGPDVLPRIGFDDQIAAGYASAGFDGFVLKSHHESTVGRASTLDRTFDLDVVGGVALNSTVGGINPATVFSALASGGRVIWFPTADAHTQEAAGLPRLQDLDRRLDRGTFAVPPVLVHDVDGEESIAQVLDLISEYDAVLATGHLSTRECRWLFDQAARRGIRRFLLTHPSYTVPGMRLGEITELAERGAYVELTAYQLFHQPGMDAAHLAAVAQAAGDKLILASDAGQPDSPPPPEAIHQLLDLLANEGIDRRRLVAAAGDTARALVLR